MKIRTAKACDRKEWAEMRSLLWPDSADGHVAEIKEYFSGKSIDIVEAFVVEDEEGALSGFMELNIRNFAEGSRSPRLPYVEAWFVRADYRGRGYGKALMRHAEKWAIERGYQELASDTEIENTKSIAIHKQLGFIETERVVCFLKKLS
ncbi:MAG: GNAT family N-acetyltransferase [Candidatus Thiodiazotropha sp. (ex Monitilora ramsayi)]|nr:GNAT family N-acetyltransferase [Candidatus Thiodiazotropha sp. (ex Monitilora ramsayi)]